MNMSNLPDFEGTEVHSASVAITNAGDGLSDALKIKPEALHHGDEVFYVLRGRVRQINHVPTKDDDGALVRKHAIVTESITRIDPKIAKPILEEAEQTVQVAKERAKGKERLPLEDAAPAAPAKRARKAAAAK